MKTEKCERCGEALQEKKIQWLELSITDGKYYRELPEGHESQGAFPFGTDCAKQELAPPPKKRGLPQGTTQSQWDAYEIELKEHNEKWDAIKPQLRNFATSEEYLAAVSKWAFESLVSAPNEPGYIFANND